MCWLFRARLLALLALVCLGACQPQIVSLTPPPTPETWQVETTPALRWLGPVFHKCATGLAGANLVLNERPAGHPQGDGAQVDFSFQWGDPRPAAMGFAAVIGYDSLVVVVNPANPVSKLTQAEVTDLFSGKKTNWNLSSGAGCSSCGPDFDGVVQAYVYAPGEDVRTAAGWIPAGPAAVLAPGPAEVRAAVAKERFSVGYVPARWLDSTLKVVTIEPAVPVLVAPVLAFAPVEPQGAKRAWLACVQDALK